MLFLLTANHTAETCPAGVFRPDSEFMTKLIDATNEQSGVKGIKLVKGYAAPPEHTFWLVVEADSMQAISTFCLPLMRIGKVTITPVLTLDEQLAWLERGGPSTVSLPAV